MSTIQPPSAPPPQLPLALPRAVILTAPPALLEMGLGTKLDVQVSDILPANNQIAVTTQLGEVTLRLPFQPAIKVGDALILRLLGNPQQPTAQLATPDGKPLTALAQGTSQSPLQTLQQGAAPQGAPLTVQVRPGAVIPTTLLRPITLGANLTVQLPSPPGAALQTGSGQAPAAAGQPAAATPATATTPTASGTPTQATPQSAGTPPTAAQGPTAFPAGSGLVLKVVTVTPPQGPSPSLTPPAPPGGTISLAPGATLAGTASGQQGVQHTVVQTQAGPVSIPTAQALPAGTALTFEVVSLTQAAPAQTAHGAAGAVGDPLFQKGWPTLDEAVEQLRDLAPGAHQHLLQAALPRADAQLTTNVLFFLSALRGGDIKSWIGDGPARILERQRPDLAGRLRDDIGQLSRTVDDPQGGEWRLQALPFLHGDEIDRILMMHRDTGGDDAEDGGEPGGSRFVIDLNLSRLGHVQIDGLVGDKGKRLDLVLRTDEPLPPRMREEIRALYTNAIEVTGIEGSVGFQAAPGNFVRIPKPGAAHQPSGGVVI